MVNQEISQLNKTISIPERIVVKELAEKMDLPVTEVIVELMKNGIMSSMNEWIDFETAAVIAEDLGFTVKKSEEEPLTKEEVKILEEAILKDEKNLKPRPPVVVVMGHVDHGKTKLLDAIRETNVVDQEAGGITQSIGAYQVEDRGRLLTLIDTPGHEAFSAMRSRGAKVADVAILVVAADDGVKPQTKEALSIIQKAKIPFLVAINKIDKPEANIEKVKKELADLGLIPEEWGGKTITVLVSAKMKKGIKELLDMVLLLADIEKKNIVANPNREAIGTIIESSIDKGAGPQATVLVQTGTLKVTDNVIVGEVPGKIKSLKDWRGKIVAKAEPAKPVRILGLKAAPQVGDILHVTKDRDEIKEMIKKQRLYVLKKKIDHKVVPKKKRVEPASKSQGELSLREEKKEEDKKEKTVSKFKIFLKSDTLGSQEAILESLAKMRHPEVEVTIVGKGLGNITEKDVLQADSTEASLVGFNIVLTSQAREVIKDRRVEVKIFNIIYELIDFIKEQLEKMLIPEIVQDELGKVEILAVFRTEKDFQIIGGRVLKGKVLNDTKARIYRGGEKIGDGKIIQLQSEKKNVAEVPKDSECGLKFRSEVTIQMGDRLEIYREEKKERRLEFVN